MATKTTAKAKTKLENSSPDPKFVAAAMKRVMPLMKKLPKHLQLPQVGMTKAAMNGAVTVHRKRSTEERDAPIVFGGDLVIDGSFDIGCVCVVLGDLFVDGVIESLHDDATLVVGGSIRARGIGATDQIHAAGSIAAEVVFVELEGKLTAKKGVTTDLLVLESKRVKVAGKVTAKHRITLTYPDPKGIEALQELLDPKAFGTVSEHLYDYTDLFAALRKGKPWKRAKRR